MTKAYIEGFCKTAEEYGVDPEALMKEAGIPQAYLPKNIGKTIMRYTPRSLFGAGNIKALKEVASNPATPAYGPARDLLAKALSAANMRRDTEIARVSSFLSGAYPGGIPRSIAERLNAITSSIRSRKDTLTRYLTPSVDGNPDIAALRKAISSFL